MPKPNRLRPSHAVALLLAVPALLVSACSSDGGGTPEKTVTTTGSSATSSGSVSTPASTPASSTAAATRPVHIKTLNSDGVTYGVGMPVIAYFNRKITSAAELQAKTKVTVDHKSLPARWYFESSSANKGYPIEGHLRPQTYWPAHSKVHVDIPMKGASAGKGLAFDNSLTLDFSIGARHVSTVNNATHKMTVTSDGHKYGTFPVSLGASNTRTRNGIKVIMEKGLDISMRGPGYYDAHVKFTQRLTYGGEYLHSAPWNTSNISRGVNSSNGCTNLMPSDAEKLYHFLRIGDVVTYPNADGPRMQLGQGYGDWNVSWGEWQTGGLVSTA